jgi:hypothetical protein
MAQAGYSRDAEEPAVTLDMFPLMLELNGRFAYRKYPFLNARMWYWALLRSMRKCSTLALDFLAASRKTVKDALKKFALRAMTPRSFKR